MSAFIAHRARPAALWLPLSLFWAVFPAAAATDERPLVIAVLDFEADRKELVPAAKEVTDLLIVGLGSQHLILVERQRLGARSRRCSSISCPPA